jgi:hypothetical protein
LIVDMTYPSYIDIILMPVRVSFLRIISLPDFMIL